MRDLLARLRAVLTPHAGVIMAAALLAVGFALSASGRSTSALEKRTASVLSSAAGAGKVDVVIMMRAAENGGTRANMWTSETPAGAVVVAQGADDPVVCLELQQAVCALLSLPASAVSVVEGEK